MWAEDTNYDINIDNDGDARADVTYRWRFKTKYRDPELVHLQQRAGHVAE